MKVLMSVESMAHIVNQSEMIFMKNIIMNLLKKDSAYKCYCTEEELEKEREDQMAQDETPHYSGKCRHLTLKSNKRFRSRRTTTKHSI